MSHLRILPVVLLVVLLLVLLPDFLPVLLLHPYRSPSRDDQPLEGAFFSAQTEEMASFCD